MPRACPVEAHARSYVASNVKLHGTSPWHLVFCSGLPVSCEHENSTGQARGIFGLLLNLFDQPQGVVAGDEWDVFVSAEILQKLE